MDTEALALLLSLGERGSLSAVARQHDVAVSTITRRLDALEAKLGIRLIDRRANGARLTEQGMRIAALAAPLVDQAAQISRTAAALKASATGGTVTISATEMIIADTLAPALPDLWRSAPGLAVTLRAQAEVVSLAARAADIAIRMARPHEPSLVARKIGEIPLGLFASADFLGAADPARIDLGAARLLVYDDSYGRIAETDWVAAAGLTGAVMLRTGSTRALLAACAAGAGVALLPVPAALRAGLIALPAPLVPPPRPAWMLTHRDLNRLPAIRTAQRWIARAFAARERS